MIGRLIDISGRKALLAGAVALALSGCGAAHPHRRHHHHRHHDGQAAAGPKEVVGSPKLAPVYPGVAGLQSVPVALPLPRIQMSPPSAVASMPAEKAFARRIADAPAGAVVHLASGVYPEFRDHVARGSWVTVSGEGDATKPVIAGARLLGASHVRFVDVQFSSGIHVTHLPNGGHAARSHDIEVLNSVIDCGANQTGPGKDALNVHGASYDITFSGDDIRNCVVGFSSGASNNYSKHITLSHCRFSNIYGDAIDLGGIDGMEIVGNVISGVHRTPGRVYHDDGIQFFGNTANVVIAYNVEKDSTDQLIFIQDAAKNRYNGSATNQDILVLGNLVYGAGALAVQDEGGVNVQFIGNTIWDGKDGSVRIRRSPYSHLVPTDTLLADNIIQSISFKRVPSIVYGYNVITHAGPLLRGNSDVLTSSAGLIDPASGAFGLTSHSPAKGSAAPVSKLVEMARKAGANATMLALIKDYHATNRGSPIAEAPGANYGAADRTYGSGF